MNLTAAFRNSAKARNKKQTMQPVERITTVKVGISGTKQVYCNALQTSTGQI